MRILDVEFFFIQRYGFCIGWLRLKNENLL